MKKLFNKYKEIILYLLFGGLATVVSIGSFYYFANIVNITELIANILSWIITVAFAYVTNKLFVFNSRTHSFKELFREIISFFSARLLTLVLEEIILYVGIEWLQINNMIVKLFAQILVVLGNYVLSKLFIFKK